VPSRYTLYRKTRSSLACCKLDWVEGETRTVAQRLLRPPQLWAWCRNPIGIRTRHTCCHPYFISTGAFVRAPTFIGSVENSLPMDSNGLRGTIKKLGMFSGLMVGSLNVPLIL
jgi:hypothetical protein